MDSGNPLPIFVPTLALLTDSASDSGGPAPGDGDASAKWSGKREPDAANGGGDTSGDGDTSAGDGASTNSLSEALPVPPYSIRD